MQVTNDDIRAAQIVTGATFAAFVLVGFVPGLRAHGQRIRWAITALYLLTVAGFMLYLLAR